MPVDYDGVVDYVLSEAQRDGVTPDPREVMQVAAQGLAGIGVKMDANHMAGLSEASRRRLRPQENPISTADTGPSVTGYLEGMQQVPGQIADVGRVAGKQLQLGSTALASGILSQASIPGAYGPVPLMDEGWRNAAADQLRQQSQELSQAQEQAGTFGSIVGGLATLPLASAAVMGSTTQKAVEMQDAGRNLTDPMNRVNLGATAGLQTGLAAIGGASGGAALKALSGGSNLGMTGVRGALAASGTGAAAGVGTTAAQHAVDVATGNEEFSPGAADYAMNAAAGGLLPLGFAAAGVPGALRRARQEASVRKINMDQLLADDATIAAQAPAMEAPVDRGVDPMPDTANGVRLPGGMDPDLAATARDATLQKDSKTAARQMRMRAKPDTEAAPMEGFTKNPSQEDLIAKQLADEEARNNAEMEAYQEEQRLRDNVAENELDNEAYEAQIEAEARAFAAKYNLDPDSVVADVRAARATERVTGDPEVYKVLRAPEQMGAETAPVRMDDGTTPDPTGGPATAVPDARAQAIREQQGNRLRNAQNARTEQQVRASKETAKAARQAVREAYQAERLDRRTAQQLMNELGQKQLSEQRAAEIKTLNENPQATFVGRTATELAEQSDLSGYQTLEEQLGRELDNAADSAPVQEGTPGIAPEPRYIVEPATGKARLVTERMAVDPKETVSYEQLTPEQRNRVDVAAKNASRKTAGREARLYSGVPLRVADVADAAKSAARFANERAKSVAKVIAGGVGDRTGLTRAVRTMHEVFGGDMQDRLAKSSDADVRAVGQRLGRSLEEQHASRQRMITDWNAAKKLTAAEGFNADAIRKANTPINPVDPQRLYTTTPLINAYEGKGPVPLGVQRAVDGVRLANKASRNEVVGQGIKVVGSGGDNVFVRHYSSDFYQKLAEGPKTPHNQAFIKVMAEGNGVSPDVIEADFWPESASGVLSAQVRLDAMEQKRKWRFFPAALREAPNKPFVMLLEADPTRYVNSVFESASRRVGFHKGFDGASAGADLGSIIPGVKLPEANKADVIRAINAYNGQFENKFDMSSGSLVAWTRDAKQVYAALKTSAGALINATEGFNIAASVPAEHIITGTVNAAVKNRGRAVAEGGIEADVPNRVDLRRKTTEVAGNVRGFVTRAVGNNAVNRGVHTLAYESGRSWAASMQKAGKVSVGDEFFLDSNRVSDAMQKRFKTGTASDQDVKVLATMIAENVTGNKRNAAQQGRLSRNEWVSLLGPLFRRYGENRVRNLIRTADAAAANIARNGVTPAVIARIAQSVAATGVSTAAATTVAGALAYGINALPLYFGSGQALVPLVVNLLGGALSGQIVDQISKDADPELSQVARSLAWPFGAVADVYGNVTKGTPEKIVPLVNRVMNIGEGERKDKIAYTQFRKVQREIEGPTGSGFKANPYRKPVHEAIFRGDKTALRQALMDAQSKMDRATYRRFLQNTRLLPVENSAKKQQYFEKLGTEMYQMIEEHDSEINKLLR